MKNGRLHTANEGGGGSIRGSFKSFAEEQSELMKVGPTRGIRKVRRSEGVGP